MTNSLPPTPPRSPSPRRTLDTDSIFGSDSSRAPSPTLSSTLPSHTAYPTTDAIPDIQLQPQPRSQPHRPPPRSELSNLPALRRQHINAGYRAGLASGRDEPRTAQAGFDEGYPVGAALGMRAGFLASIARVMRGLDEGVAGTEKSADGSAAADLSLEALVSDMQARGVLGREMTVDDLDAASGGDPDGVGAGAGAALGEGEEVLWKPQPERWLDEVPALRDVGERVRAWSEAVGVAGQWGGEGHVHEHEDGGRPSGHAV